ncbi:MAG TPA: hypothetical protein VHY19_06890 [Steroidobacteraceae bacterium]|jgi:hypothetical protein|nr:hypothetical protein [Steroidobacteraceae bacterium]
MWCTAFLTGPGLGLDHPRHSPGEHEVLVYIVRGDNPELFEDPGDRAD